MDPDRHAGARDVVGEEDQMVLVRMHAAGRSKPHQMAGAAALLQRRDQLGQDRVPGERAVLDGVVDARQLRHGDAAGAQVHVADLGIAHLALGQADEALGGVYQALRAGRDQAIVVGRARVEDGVVGRIGAMAPAVEDAEDRGTQTRSHQDAEPGRAKSGRRGARCTELNLLGQERSRGSVSRFWSGTSMAQNTNSPRGSPSMVMS